MLLFFENPKNGGEGAGYGHLEALQTLGIRSRTNQYCPLPSIFYFQNFKYIFIENIFGKIHMKGGEALVMHHLSSPLHFLFFENSKNIF